MSGKIPWIDELKGLAIALVILHHMSHFSDVLALIHGEIGVDIFFLLSGFGLTINLHKDEDAFSFYRRRFSNIIPAYWFTLGLVYFLNSFINYTYIDMANVVIHLLCLQALGLEDHFFFGLAMSLWFVGAVSILYIVFPFLKRLIISKQAVYIAALGFFIPFVCMAFIYATTVVRDYDGFLWLFMARVPDFFIGICAGILYCNRGLRFSGKSIAILIAAASLYFYMVTHRRVAFFFYPFIGIAICYLYVLLRENVFKKITLTLAFAGTISYELYLIHHTVIGYLNPWVWEHFMKKKYVLRDYNHIPIVQRAELITGDVGWILICIVAAYLINRGVSYLRGIGFLRLLANERSFVVYTVVVVFTALYCVISYWVNVPFDMQWTYYGVSPAALFSQGRLGGFLSNLVSYLAGLTSGFDTRAEIAVSFAVLCLILFNLYLLVRHIVAVYRNGLVFVFALVLFSPDVWRELLWGRQFAVYLPVLLLTVALNISVSGLTARVKVFLYSILAISGAFTYETAAANFSIAKGTAASRIITGIIPAGWPVMPDISGIFVCLCLSSLYILPVIYIRRHRPQAITGIYVWVIIGAFALANIIASSMGLWPPGVYSNIFLISAIVLVYMFFINARSEMQGRIFTYCRGAAIVFLIIVYLCTYGPAVNDMKGLRLDLESGKAAIKLMEFVFDEGKLKKLYPDTNAIAAMIQRLKKHRRFDVQPVPPAAIKFIAGEHWGQIDNCTFHGNTLEISGWAVNKRTKAPAGNVILNTTDAQGSIMAFSILIPHHKRDDIRDFFKKPSVLNSGFMESVDTSALTSGANTITAFTIDIDKGVSYPLESSCTIVKKEPSNEALFGSLANRGTRTKKYLLK